MDLPVTMPGAVSDWAGLFESDPASRHRVPSKRLIDKTVLITGAGGSIGSFLAHAVWAASPGTLVLLDSSEAGLYEIDRSLREAGSHQHVSLLGSVCDPDTLRHLFQGQRPQVIFHAAALKHVPLMERNPFAAIATNVLGTLTLADTAAAFDTEHLVLISTDKAVAPQSIMGASKRLAELGLLATGATTRTRMTAVRLGNVAGSQGSVLPLFLAQIARGGPLTVTHSDAHRYFMPIDAAVNAVLSALEFQSSPAILVPDLGAPVRILDLAHRLLKLHGSSASIEFTGLRAGDKMTESLLSANERWADRPASAVSDAGLRAIVSPASSLALVHSVRDELSTAIRSCDLPRLLRAVAVLVPEYQSSALLQAALAPSTRRDCEATA